MFKCKQRLKVKVKMAIITRDGFLCNREWHTYALIEVSFSVSLSVGRVVLSVKIFSKRLLYVVITPYPPLTSQENRDSHPLRRFLFFLFFFFANSYILVLTLVHILLRYKYACK